MQSRAAALRFSGRFTLPARLRSVVRFHVAALQAGIILQLASGGIELKAGNRLNQHIVAIKRKGDVTEYALVHVRISKRGDSI